GSKIDAMMYKYASEEETQLPFDFNIFTSKAAGGKQKVSLELEFTESAINGIQVGIAVQDEPKLLKIDNSTSDFDAKTSMITWVTGSLSEEKQSSMMQFYTTTEEEALFPLKLSFEHMNDVSHTEQMFIRFLLI